MKRDMELIRTILLEVEAVDSYAPHPSEGCSPQHYLYNCYLIHNAGLAAGVTFHEDPPDVRLSHLTWRGHEFLDAIRQDTVWEKTKSSLGTQITSVGFEIVKGVANSFVTQKLKEMGVPIG